MTNYLDTTWVKQQARAFTAWVNLHLKDVDIALDYEKLPEGLESGIALCELFNVLRSKKDELHDVTPIKPNRNPRMRLMQIENNSRAISALAQHFGLRITTSAEEICDGEIKLILGLLWVIIAKVDVSDISEEELTARDGLLAWCKRVCAPYGVKIDNFHHSWQSGLGFMALAHSYDKSLFDWAQVAAEVEAAEDDEAQHALRVKYLTQAFELIEDHMGIPKTFLDPEEMADLTVKPDDKSCVVYLSQIYSKFAGRQQYDQAANAVNRVVNQLRQIERAQNDYVERAQALVAFCAEFQPQYVDHPVFATEGETREAGRQAKEFLYDTHGPAQQVALAEAVAVFQSIQTRRKADGRAVWVAPEGLEPETVGNAVDECFDTVRAYIAHVRAEIVRHYELQRSMTQYNSAVAKAESYCTQQAAPALARPLGANASMITLQERVIEQLLADQAKIAAAAAQLPELAEGIAQLSGPTLDHAEVVAKVEATKPQLEERLVALKTAREEEEARFALVSEVAASMQNVYGQIEDLNDTILVPLARDSFAEASEGLAALKAAATSVQEISDDVEAVAAKADETAAVHADLLADFTALTAATIRQAHAKAAETAAANIEAGEAIVSRLETEAAAATAVHAQADELAQALATHATAVDQAAAIDGVDESLAAWYEAQKALNEAGFKDTIEALEREAAVTEDGPAIAAVSKVAAEYSRLASTIDESVDALNRQKLAAAELEVPAEVVEEWQATFRQFDRDNSGTLQRFELDAMLVATDQSIPAHKMDALFESTDGIDFQSFSEVMNQLRKQGTTADGIKDAFATLANGSETISQTVLAQHFDDETAAFLAEKLTKTDDDTFSYSEFSNAAFM